MLVLKRLGLPPLFCVRSDVDEEYRLHESRPSGSVDVVRVFRKDLARGEWLISLRSTALLTDILSDEFGLSFHRLQMAAWTVAMVGVFLVAVWRTFAMPEFDATMLGLLGISSGTHLGFTFPRARATRNSVGRETGRRRARLAR